jgi:hypothetical protein
MSGSSVFVFLGWSISDLACDNGYLDGSDEQPSAKISFNYSFYVRSLFHAW